MKLLTYNEHWLDATSGAEMAFKGGLVRKNFTFLKLIAVFLRMQMRYVFKSVVKDCRR